VPFQAADVATIKVLLQNEEEKELSLQLQTALEPAVRLQTFPKSTVDVYCLVVESGGSDLAVCATAAAAALADAGIEMNDLVAACCVVSYGAVCMLCQHLQSSGC
jgi:exosome complex component MTR3